MFRIGVAKLALPVKASLDTPKRIRTSAILCRQQHRGLCVTSVIESRGCRQFSVWPINNKDNLDISAGMPKSSDHGWQAVDYERLNPFSSYRPWPGFRHPCRNDGASGQTENYCLGLDFGIPAEMTELRAKLRSAEGLP